MGSIELEGKNEKGLPHSVKLTDNGLVIKEGNSSANPTSEFISFNEIEEIMFYEGKDNTVDLDIELKITDRIIAIEGIKDNNLVDEFSDFTDKILSDKPVTNDKLDESEKCPKCNKILNKGSVFCSECGYEIKSNNKTKICPYCAEEISSRAVKCKHCGEWLNKQAKIQSKSDNHTAAIILGYIFSLLGGIIGLIFAFYLLSQENKGARLQGLIMLFINCIWLCILGILIIPVMSFIALVLSTILIIVGFVIYARE